MSQSLTTKLTAITAVSILLFSTSGCSVKPLGIAGDRVQVTTAVEEFREWTVINQRYGGSWPEGEALLYAATKAQENQVSADAAWLSDAVRWARDEAERRTVAEETWKPLPNNSLAKVELTKNTATRTWWTVDGDQTEPIGLAGSIRFPDLYASTAQFGLDPTEAEQSNRVSIELGEYAETPSWLFIPFIPEFPTVQDLWYGGIATVAFRRWADQYGFVEAPDMAAFNKSLHDYDFISGNWVDSEIPEFVQLPGGDAFVVFAQPVELKDLGRVWIAIVDEPQGTPRLYNDPDSRKKEEPLYFAVSGGKSMDELRIVEAPDMLPGAFLLK